MAYEMEIKDEAKARLRALPEGIRREIGHRLHLLQRDFTGDVKKLQGSKNQYRLRVSEYRVLAQAKIVLRELRDTLEDLDDRRELTRAKQRNAGKRGTDWETVKKELGFKF